MSAGRHVLLSLLAAGSIAALAAQRRCAAPVQVSVRELWDGGRDRWTGRSVQVAGELKEFAAGTEGEHYAVEEDGFRVGLRGEASPAPKTLLGRRVVARGVFVFSEKGGGALDSPVLAPAP